MSMLNCNCQCRCNCALIAVVVSVILGVIAAFLQITGVITVGTAFLWVVLGISVVYLGVLIIANAQSGGCGGCECKCSSLGVILAGIVGGVLSSVIQLAVVATATVFGAILVGLLVLSLGLIVGGSVCYTKCLADCGN